MEAEPHVGRWIVGTFGDDGRWGGGAATATPAANGEGTFLEDEAFGSFNEADRGAGALNDAQAGVVAFFHAGGVDFDGHDGLWTGRNHAERIARVVEIGGGQGVKAEYAGLLGEGPFGVVG